MPPTDVAYTLNPIAPTQVNRFVSCTDPFFAQTANVSGARILNKSGISRSLISGSHAIHPEGSLIYFDGKVVSSQPTTNTHRIIGNNILTRCGDAIAKAQVTVFVEIKGDLQADYYVAVHDHKMVIWVDQQLPDSFSGATPSRHDHEYWIHMENFPAPVFSSVEDRQELMDVMASSAIDAATSDGSTSPMSAEQLVKHLKTIKEFSDKMDVHQTYAVARIWNMLLQSRVINRYGTPEARLDRFITISERPPRFTGVYMTMDKLMFHGPGAHLLRCSRAWADRIAYTQEWRKLKARNEEEWQQVLHLACVLVIASLLINSQSVRPFRVLSTLSLLAGLGSVAGVYYLLNESQNLGDHAADASAYFQQREEYAYGVQRIAIINAMPQALLVWGFIFFVAAVISQGL